MLTFPQCFSIWCDSRRVLFIPAGHAGGIGTDTGRFNHALERKVTQRIRLDKLSNFLDRHLRGYQISLVWSIDAVVTRTNSRRATDAQVDLFGARFRPFSHLFEVVPALLSRQFQTTSSLIRSRNGFSLLRTPNDRIACLVR